MCSSDLPAGYNLVWSDEFNGAVGSAPNPANWTYDTGAGGWGNNELENYTTSTNNSVIVSDPNANDGKALAIIAIDTQPGNSNYGAVGRYTSARLLSSGLQSFQYGYMEARIQMPFGDGIWPAFWMLGTNIGAVGWPACGEMDIMENIGNSADQLLNHGSLHAPNWNPTATTGLPSGALYHNAYHTFGLLWQANQVQFYVDGNLYETHTAAECAGAGGTYEFNTPFFFLLNLAVGGSWPGSPDAGTSFPQTMLVDYVRVYQASAGTPVPTPTPVVSSTWRVNAGGPQYTDSQGNVWSADTNYSGGTVGTNTNTTTGTPDPTLYQTERYGNPFTYTFNVPPGSYQVTLKLSENYWTAAGDRIFDVSINGTQVLTNLDLYSEVGESKADDKVFNNIQPSGGTITIQFGPASVDNANVNAIQIIPMPSTPTFTPTWTSSATATRTPTLTSTRTPTATWTSSPTATRTPTLSPTLTKTSTLSPTPTSIPPTLTATSTVTGTPTHLATATLTTTFTATQTPVNSATLTPTAGAVHTATSTLSATPSWTGTATLAPPSLTPTRTPVFTPSPTGSATPTLTLTAAPSLTKTPTLLPTQTPRPSFTATFTLTATATWTATVTATPTISDTFSPTPSATVGVELSRPIPYPNPVSGPGPIRVRVDLRNPQALLTMKVYTIAFRKVEEETFQNVPAGPNDFPLSLKTPWGMDLANGLYYIEVEIASRGETAKLLILR